MSLQQDTTTTQIHAIRLNAGRFSFTMRHMLAPLIESHQSRRINDIRKATRREIAHLPASLQEDLAFSDGTVIATE
jgi:hypothetical protein